VSFREITDMPYCRTLIDLSEQYRRQKVDADTERFCTELICLKPKDGDAFYFRAFVRHRLGHLTEALQDAKLAWVHGGQYERDAKKLMAMLSGLTNAHQPSPRQPRPKTPR